MRQLTSKFHDDFAGEGSITWCNGPTIGSSNHYHLSANGIPSGNQWWYGLVYLVYKYLVNLG